MMRVARCKNRNNNIQATFERCLGQQLRPNRNSQALARCPFHKDRLPSLSINVALGLWHCFAGCGGGTVRDFEKRMRGVR
jgi:putative DNA primase/helicase